MNTLIVYDSVWGNTEKIAKAIGDALSGQINLVRAADAKTDDLKSFDMVIVGSPTQGGRPLKTVQGFLDAIPGDGLSKVKVAAFDTRTQMKGCLLFVLGGVLGFAAPRIASALKNKGGQMAVPPAGFLVTGKEGPLIQGELERAAEWAKGLISQAS
jgi:flavodoxin